MAATEMLFVFAYDVRRDLVRRRLVAVLEEKVSRVQDSVFEGWLSPAEAHRLTQLAAAELDAEDSLRVYPVQRAALRHSWTYGALPIMEPHDYWLL